MATVVIGGGAVGLCCARALALRGIDVVLVERDVCGGGASLGNAGWVTPAFSGPLPAPGVVRHALAWLARPASPFRIRPRFDLTLPLWLWRFWRSSNREQHLDGLRAVVGFAEPTFALFEELQQELGFEMHGGGVSFVLRDQRHVDEYVDLVRDAIEAGYATNAQVIPARDVPEFEPALLQSVAGVVHVAEERFLRPEDFTTKLRADLCARGVQVLEHTAVIDFVTRDSRVGGVRTTRGEIAADAVVVAAGAWSRSLVEMLGFALPLEAAKGYAFTGTAGRVVPQRALYLTEARLAVTPFEADVRLAGTLELAGIDLRVKPQSIRALRKASAAYLRPDAIPADGAGWAGLRPLLPDGLPAIGRVPRWENAFLATGHGMLGITLAPATGQVVAEMVTSGVLPRRIERFDPSRFVRRSESRESAPPPIET